MHQRAHLEQREKEQDAQRDNAEGSEPPVQISFKGIVLHGSLRRLKISVGLFAFCGCAAVGQQRFALLNAASSATSVTSLCSCNTEAGTCGYCC